jgi:hypothetical protein
MLPPNCWAFSTEASGCGDDSRTEAFFSETETFFCLFSLDTAESGLLPVRRLQTSRWSFCLSSQWSGLVRSGLLWSATLSSSVISLSQWSVFSFRRFRHLSSSDDGMFQSAKGNSSICHRPMTFELKLSFQLFDTVPPENGQRTPIFLEEAWSLIFFYFISQEIILFPENNLKKNQLLFAEFKKITALL